MIPSILFYAGLSIYVVAYLASSWEMSKQLYKDKSMTMVGSLAAILIINIILVVLGLIYYFLIGGWANAI
ncbi:hypothetical protein CHH53_03955 [Terribacillus sp. 7520-G]|nr:hypothetical protein CHH53_03955 [Terribacillus sp. 7520-G]